jgi:hypothetical protein
MGRIKGSLVVSGLGVAPPSDRSMPAATKFLEDLVEKRVDAGSFNDDIQVAVLGRLPCETGTQDWG